MNEEQTQVPQNEEEVDQLLENIEQPSDESAIEPGAKQETPEEAAQKQAIQEFAFSVGGKEIKLDLNKDREKLIRWAQQGYEAPNRIGELNKTLESYKSKEQQFKEWQERFGPVDEYVRQNPQWWQYVQTQYEQLQQQQKDHSPVLSLVEQLSQKVSSLENVAKTYEERQREIAVQQEDAKLMEEMTAIQKQYPKIDFSTPDQTGKTLEYKVLEFAKEKGIREFTTAFKAFYHDELVKHAAEQAKENVIKDKQSKSKLGILGISTTPTRRVSDSVKGKTYADLEREALQELGIG